jgi:plastocyanin
MRVPASHPKLLSVVLLAALAASAVLAIVWQLRGSPTSASAANPGIHLMSGGMNMSDDAMRAEVMARFKLHPPHAKLATSPPVDSFLAVNFRFDRDGSAATQVDTAHITAGESVRFKWGTGFHTLTSGDGSSDPNSGVLFDLPMTSAADNVNLEFDTEGTFPFYCQVHEGSNMFGFVVVSAPVGVGRTSSAARIGFVQPPWPNPTRGGASFRFAIPRAGDVRIEVFDAAGRLVATPVHRAYEAGTFGGSWDGRNAAGSAASAGIYYLRLAAPGVHGTERVTIER